MTKFTTIPHGVEVWREGSRRGEGIWEGSNTGRVQKREHLAGPLRGMVRGSPSEFLTGLFPHPRHPYD